MTVEGGLDRPIRHGVAWQDAAYYDEEALNEELLRVFDICHGCRRCFNLCDSFPRLFDMIDESPTGELDSVDKRRYGEVVTACTLCDMCFLTKCPYVPPHPFNLDFPKLMLRYRAIEFKKKGAPLRVKILTDTDTNGKIGTMLAPVANWATKETNSVTRPLLEKTMGVDSKAALPKFCGKTLLGQFNAQKKDGVVNKNAPSYGERAVLYATCFGNYNQPQIGMAALKILQHNGVETEVVYEGCCGMPKLEHGDLPFVASQAKKISQKLQSWIHKGYRIVPLVPSCTLMFKSEWPLLLPKDDDVSLLSSNTMDLTEYIVFLAKSKGLADGMRPMEAKTAIHLACHGRAQNMGPKAAEMLRFIPKMTTAVVERCSGHGGSWGMMKGNFETAMKIGRPTAQKALQQAPEYLASDCPLAGAHLIQEVQRIDPSSPLTISLHPIEILAKSYGF